MKYLLVYFGIQQIMVESLAFFGDIQAPNCPRFSPETSRNLAFGQFRKLKNRMRHEK